MNKKDLELTKKIINMGFVVTGIFWGLIFAVIIYNSFLSVAAFLGATVGGFILGSLSNLILDFCYQRDLKKAK